MFRNNFKVNTGDLTLKCGCLAVFLYMDYMLTLKFVVKQG